MSAQPKDEYATAVRAEAPAVTRRSDDGVSARSSDHDFQLASRQLVEVLCECGHPNCTGEITMSLKEYEAVRLDPMRFLIKEGHELADVVRVVDYGAGYVVVAKYRPDALSVRDLR
jgi:hypothetical protein